MAPESLSWMGLQLVRTLFPVATCGTCCSNTGKVSVGGQPRALLDSPWGARKKVSDME